MPTHLIVLGRDGVINNRVPNGVRSAMSWQPIPGSLRAIARLNSARFQVVVANSINVFQSLKQDHTGS